MSDAATEAELVKLEEKRAAALVARDAAALEALFADDLVHIHTTGNQMDKRELIHYVTHVLQFLSLARSNVKVRVYGNCAVMTGTMTSSMRRTDKPEPINAEALVTQVWVKSGGGWKLTSFHATRAAAPGG
jgi:uncharacterized protein (TIGR02246 family)